LSYLIVGKGNDTERVQALAAELGMADCLTLCGFVPDEELADHYRLANVYAMPSDGEGFGIVFLEAMACGIPVLAGNLDGSVDALADGKLGQLVDPRSIEAIADGLVALLSGKGPADWFKPEILRAQCMEHYGQGAFREGALQLIASLEKRPRLE
jgi:glycosyltransferase involved in cell wall biosynthesis